MRINSDRGIENPCHQNWDLYRFFLSVARAGSISAASNQLSESPATVGRKIRELETALSATLLDRSVSGITLTSCGSRMVEHAEQMECQIRSICEAVFADDGQLKGAVTVAAPSGLGQTVLAPHLRELHNRHPAIRIQLALATARVNLFNREADIAVRIGGRETDRLVSEKLGDVRFGLYASPLYLDQLDPFQSSADLDGHNIIAGTGALAETAQVQEFATLTSECNVALTTDSIFAQLEAVRSGLGIAPLPHYLGRAYPGLIELLPGLLKSSAELWLLMHPDLKDIARVKMVHEFLSDICKRAINAQL